MHAVGTLNFFCPWCHLLDDLSKDRSHDGSLSQPVPKSKRRIRTNENRNSASVLHPPTVTSTVHCQHFYGHLRPLPSYLHFYVSLPPIQGSYLPRSSHPSPLQCCYVQLSPPRVQTRSQQMTTVPSLALLTCNPLFAVSLFHLLDSLSRMFHFSYWSPSCTHFTVWSVLLKCEQIAVNGTMDTIKFSNSDREV